MRTYKIKVRQTGEMLYVKAKNKEKALIKAKHTNESATIEPMRRTIIVTDITTGNKSTYTSVGKAIVAHKLKSLTSSIYNYLINEGRFVAEGYNLIIERLECEIPKEKQNAQS